MQVQKTAKSFEDLIVWQKSHQLVLEVYKFSEGFPKAEMFGITSQIRRSSSSVAANIAEGFKKWGIKDKLRYMNISQGSLEETRYFLILARDLGYGNIDQLSVMAQEVSKLIESYMSKLRQSLK